MVLGSVVRRDGLHDVLPVGELMTRERWLIVLLAALYAAVGTIEFEADRAAEERGVYAPEPVSEVPDLWMW